MKRVINEIFCSGLLVVYDFANIIIVIGCMSVPFYSHGNRYLSSPKVGFPFLSNE